MTQSRSDEQDPGPAREEIGPGPGPQGGGSWTAAGRRWMAVAAFVAGILVGALLVGALADSSPVRGDGTTAAPTGGPGSTAPSSLSPGEGQVVVNRACLRSLNAAQDVFDAVDELGSAAAELNAARLDEVVRRLQPLQDRLGQGLADCAVVGEPSVGTATGAPTGSPASGTGSPEATLQVPVPTPTG